MRPRNLTPAKAAPSQRGAPVAEALNPADLAGIISRGSVAFVGQLAQVTPEQLQEAVESIGGRFMPASVADQPDLLIVGGAGLPLTDQGDPAVPAIRSSTTLVLSEREFLHALSIAADSDAPRRHFPLPALAEILREPMAKVRAWYKAGLIQPSIVQHGIPRFEFPQVVVAQTLARLTSQGVSVAKLRRSIEQLRKWLPDIRQPLAQLDVLERSGGLLVRLEAGELAEPDGQLQMPYEPAPQGEQAQLRLVSGPSSPADWHEQGIDQERHGLFAESEASYRRALLDGGPDAQVCFDLAHALQAQGKLIQALERYRQCLELDPRHVEAWNNLGVILGELGHADDACTAFRAALRIDPYSAMAHYNLADTLEMMGMAQAAPAHWEAYVRLEPANGAWSAYARKRLSSR